MVISRLLLLSLQISSLNSQERPESLFCRVLIWINSLHRGTYLVTPMSVEACVLLQLVLNVELVGFDW